MAYLILLLFVCKYFNLDFVVDPFLKEAIHAARRSFAERTDSLDMHYFESSQLNKNLAKQHKLSPDSLMQLVIQVTYASSCFFLSAYYNFVCKCVTKCYNFNSYFALYYT